MKSCRKWREKVILQGIIGYMAIVTPIKLFWQQSQNNSKTFFYFWPLLLLSTLTLFLWQNIKKKTVSPAFRKLIQLQINKIDQNNHIPLKISKRSRLIFFKSFSLQLAILKKALLLKQLNLFMTFLALYTYPSFTKTTF